jgi:hypothetical protein
MVPPLLPSRLSLPIKQIGFNLNGHESAAIGKVII